MQIDFSEIDTSAYNEMAIAMLIFVLGLALGAWLISTILSKLKVPEVIINTIITLVVIGCLYYGMRYFL